MKLFGCLILFAVSALTGFVLAQREAERLKVLCELSLLLQKLISGIENRYPVDEILGRYNEECSPSYIKGYGRAELTASLTGLVREDICTDEAKMCMELMEYISKSCDASEIKKRCTEYCDTVSEKLVLAKNECSKKRELYIKLGVFTGLLVCITVI